MCLSLWNSRCTETANLGSMLQKTSVVKSGSMNLRQIPPSSCAVVDRSICAIRRTIRAQQSWLIICVPISSLAMFCSESFYIQTAKNCINADGVEGGRFPEDHGSGANQVHKTCRGEGGLSVHCTKTTSGRSRYASNRLDDM